MTATYQMSLNSVDAVLVAVAHELLGNGGQRADDHKDTINCPEKAMKISHLNQTE